MPKSRVDSTCIQVHCVCHYVAGVIFQEDTGTHLKALFLYDTTPPADVQITRLVWRTKTVIVEVCASTGA